MAIAAGSQVSPKVSVLGQCPGRGVVESGTSGVGPFVVLWGGSEPHREANVTLNTIDEILPAAAPALAKVGARGKITTQTGATNWTLCTIIAAYKRDVNDMLLLQNPAGGYYIEALAADVEVVP